MEKSTQESKQLSGGSLFSFDRMITPKIIQIIFYIGLVVFVLAGVGIILTGELSPVVGLLVIIVGPLLVRVNCELIIVIFKIHEALQSIRLKK